MKQLLHIPPLWHPFLLSRILAGNASLILHMTRRQLALRYKGSILGWFWSLAQPLMMLLVYTFVFGIIFKARWAVCPKVAPAVSPQPCFVAWRHSIFFPKP